jgi:hypothetical protein
MRIHNGGIKSGVSVSHEALRINRSGKSKAGRRLKLCYVNYIGQITGVNHPFARQRLEMALRRGDCCPTMHRPVWVRRGPEKDLNTSEFPGLDARCSYVAVNRL